MRKIFSIIFLMCGFTTIILGQLGKDSLSYTLRSFTDKSLFNSYEKQLNTHNFSTFFSDYFVSDQFFLGVRENFKSTIIKTTSKNIKDEQYFWAIGQYNLQQSIKLGILLNSDIYSDDRQIDLNKASLLTSTIFTKYTPEKNIEITPFGGFSQNEQIGQKDNGFIYGAEANVDKAELGDFELSSLLKYQNEDISPRKNTFRLIDVDLNSSIEQNFYNTISANYSQQRKDFYLTADPVTAAEFDITNNIQSRTESGYSLQDRIRFAPHNSALTMDFQGRIAWRGIDRNTRYISLSSIANSNYDTHIDESRLEFASGLDYLPGSFNVSIRFSYSERDEKHTPERYAGLNNLIYDERLQLEEEKNNTSQLANLSMLSKIILSSKDRLTISLLQRKLRYDTPSDQNFDDRDELLSIGRILYERDISPLFKMFINVEGNLNKIVYIFAERSSNNNIKRILKLSSGGTLTDGNFTSTNSAEVSANYTVYDYEELNPNFRSFAFRQLALRDSSTLRLSGRIRLFFTGYSKLSEQGDFKWSNFTNNPVRYLSEQYAEPKIFYDHNELSLGIGVRYFSLSTYNFQNGTEKIKVSDYTSIGPLSEISYLMGDRIILKIYGWLEFIKAEDNSNREMVNLSIRLAYKF